MTAWPHFTREELRCSHTGKCDMDLDFMEALEALRVAFARPMPISSAYRHPSHPVESRKAKPGAHSLGQAVDVRVSGAEAYDLLALALAHGFTGIGVAQKGDHATRFIHLDMARTPDAHRPWVWSY